MSVSKNLNLAPSQMRLKKRRLFFIRLYIILFFLVSIILGLAILSSHEKVKINNIIITGNAVISDDDIFETVNFNLKGRYAYLFSKSNSLIFPRFKIKSDILMVYKTIKEVDVSWEDWQTISIKVQERKPHSVWCGEDMKAVTQTCYLVDSEGYIYNIAPTFSGSIYVKNYGKPKSAINDISQGDYIGEYFLSTEIYQQVYYLIGILDQNSLKVVSVFFDENDYVFVLESGPKIIFNNKNTFTIPFDNLFTAIKTNNLVLDKEFHLIEYIDLRFDNKIIVKPKNIE